MLSNQFKTSLRLQLLIGLLPALWFMPAQAAETVVNAAIEMTCFPPPPPPGGEPGIGPPPPCLLPVGVDPRFVSPAPSGLLKLKVKDDNSARIELRLDGLAEGLVITAWASYFFPPGPAPDPIFASIGPGLPPAAAVSTPLAPTWAAFTEGLGREPNEFSVQGDQGSLKLNLDWNPLKEGWGPLRNGMANTDQALAPLGSAAGQPDCCPDALPFPRPQAVGSSLLRRFDPITGFQILDSDGNPELLRSPVPVAFIVLVIHTDETTHGINPGVPIFPIPGLSATAGDHFVLGLFDLRDFHID